MPALDIIAFEKETNLKDLYAHKYTVYINKM